MQRNGGAGQMGRAFVAVVVGEPTVAVICFAVVVAVAASVGKRATPAT